MNPTSGYSNMYCNCKTFIEDLLIFFSDINLSETHLLCKELKDFLEQYSCHKRDVIAKSCSQDLCAIILRTLEEKNATPCCLNDNSFRSKLLPEICNIIGFKYNIERSVGDICVSYYYMWKELVLKPLPLEYTRNTRALTALAGKFQYMKLLVNFGLLSTLNGDLPELILAGIDRILDEFLLTAMILDFTQRFYNKHDICSKAIDLLIQGSYKKCLKRVYLTMIAIRAVQLKLINKEENSAKEYIDCLRMYFSITKELPLTLNEVRIMLYACLYVLQKLDVFEPFYEEFIKIMPECSVKTKPLSLTDLARCQIRKDLEKCNMPLPEAVAKLNLGQPLKEFILGNVLQMSRRSEDVSLEQVVSRSELHEMAEHTPPLFPNL